MTTRYLTAALASAGAAVSILGAAVATADPGAGTETANAANPQSCNTTGEGGDQTGTQTTVCDSPGNVQINATAPSDPVYPYPWNDEFYGSAMIIGPDEPMHSYGGDGGGGGGHR